MKTPLKLLAGILLVVSACTSEESDHTVYILTENDYKISCSPTDNTAEGNPYPACLVEIPGFKKMERYEEIRRTTEAEWIELLKSDTAEIAKSASIWLHFLSHQKAGLPDLEAIAEWGDGRQEEQLGFWEAYLEQYDL